MKISGRIGIFGGLFDPPHIGHLLISQWVLEEFNLRKIIFVPSGNPPHKHRYSPYALRYHMIQLAIENNKHFMVSDIERKMTGKTYTVEVIRALRKALSGTIYVIIGSDQWAEIHTWRTPHKLFEEYQFIVVRRPPYHVSIKKAMRKRIHLSLSPTLDISSTMIRKRIGRGLSIKYLVPDAIEKYIKNKRLYR